MARVEKRPKTRRTRLDWFKDKKEEIWATLNFGQAVFSLLNTAEHRMSKKYTETGLFCSWWNTDKEKEHLFLVTEEHIEDKTCKDSGNKRCPFLFATGMKLDILKLKTSFTPYSKWNRKKKHDREWDKCRITMHDSGEYYVELADSFNKVRIPLEHFKEYAEYLKNADKKLKQKKSGNNRGLNRFRKGDIWDDFKV